jgi:WD40 repeat protein
MEYGTNHAYPDQKLGIDLLMCMTRETVIQETMSMTEPSKPNSNKEHLPAGMTFPQTLRGHTSSLNSIAWSPDGELLASGATDQTLRLWSSTGSALLDGHTSSINVVAWSPDGRVVASGSNDSTVRLWNPTTASLLHTLEDHRADVGVLDWSPDGGVLASGSADATVRLWDSTTGKLLRTLTGHTGGIRSVAWSPDGQLIASGSNDLTVRLWNSTTGECVESVGMDEFDCKIRSVAWSSHGNVLAIGGDDLAVTVWGADLSPEVPQTHMLEGPALPKTVSSVAWSPDGEVFASCGVDASVRIWSLATGKLASYLQGHTDTGEVMSVVWSPDGKLLATSASTSFSLDNAEVSIWRTDSWELLAVLKGLKDCVDVCWHPRFSILATGGYQTGDVFLWHLDLAHLFQRDRCDPSSDASYRWLAKHSSWQD